MMNSSHDIHDSSNDGGGGGSSNANGSQRHSYTTGSSNANRNARGGSYNNNPAPSPYYMTPSAAAHGLSSGGGSTRSGTGGSGGQFTFASPRNSSGTTAEPSSLRRRHQADYFATPRGAGGPLMSPTSSGGGSSPAVVVKKLDFMFPKVDQEFTVQTDRGGLASVVALGIIAILIAAETAAWVGQNRRTVEHISVDTDLGRRMRVNINITFPALACDDLHVDVMDVAGDSQLNVDDTLIKQPLSMSTGRPLGKRQIVESNQHRTSQQVSDEIKKQEVPDNYCGPCFGAQEKDGECCNTCDELIAAYNRKSWKTEIVTMTSEQCIREGRDKVQPKRMTQGQGCNLSGFMVLNRVAGNFHIAMGEGIERDGRHIHTFVPEDTPNFNASHVIHDLSFGPQHNMNSKKQRRQQPQPQHVMAKDRTTLNGVTKIVTKEHGTTGLFQYFIKVVPTTYFADSDSNKATSNKRKKTTRSNNVLVDKNVQYTAAPSAVDDEDDEGNNNNGIVETNRYFFTERFRPLMKEYIEDEHYKAAADDNSTDTRIDTTDKLAAVPGGHSGQHSKSDHHAVQNAILPGVFFLYEIYPFAVEISPSTVPFTHLLIRIMATIGGVFTIVRAFDSVFYERDARTPRNKR